ncbi:unnamed protein product, partial [marine sediment metagenome]
IPRRWEGFRLTRRFRGGTYEITVSNPHKLCRGVNRLIVNGRQIDGNSAPLPTRGGQRLRVEVLLEP